MTPAVTLTRPWPEDAGDITAALSQWSVTRWLTRPPWPYGAENAQDFIAAAGLDEHAIRLGDRLVGMVQAGRAFGIWVAPDLQGQGIGRRAGVLALSRQFQTGADAVFAHCLVGNERSGRLLDWLGFVPQDRVHLHSRALDRQVEADLLHLDRARFASRHGIALTTARLSIDAVTPADLPALQRIAQLPQVARMMLRHTPPLTTDLSEGALLPPLRLAVRHQGAVIGAVGLSSDTPARLHYLLDPARAGQGFGQEMVSAVFHEVVARLNPPEILGDVFLDNPASRKILKNLGFRRADDVALMAEGRDEPANAALYRWRPGLLL